MDRDSTISQIKVTHIYQEEAEKMRYKIVRFYKADKPSRVIRKGLTLKEAQEHCNDPATRKEGVYFDGYESM